MDPWPAGCVGICSSAADHRTLHITGHIGGSSVLHHDMSQDIHHGRLGPKASPSLSWPCGTNTATTDSASLLSWYRSRTLPLLIGLGSSPFDKHRQTAVENGGHGCPLSPFGRVLAAHPCCGLAAKQTHCIAGSLPLAKAPSGWQMTVRTFSGGRGPGVPVFEEGGTPPSYNILACFFLTGLLPAGRSSIPSAKSSTSAGLSVFRGEENPPRPRVTPVPATSQAPTRWGGVAGAAPKSPAHNPVREGRSPRGGPQGATHTGANLAGQPGWPRTNTVGDARAEAPQSHPRYGAGRSPRLGLDGPRLGALPGWR